MDAMEALDRLGAAQHGLVTGAQVDGAGWAASGRRRLVAAGRLLVVRPGVYRLAGAPVTWEQGVLAAVLAAGPGAVVSHGRRLGSGACSTATCSSSRSPPTAGPASAVPSCTVRRTWRAHRWSAGVPCR